ncbi:peptidase M48 [Streptomyces tateyamensis]|uniref:Peptidase M48 n=1 Tax=Streptomyces tateyamensis TaxID=565073 RepID=A0A2V4NAN7_9ACTN|nr:M48 family metallopeptidase [Streptomyces tateyamensis]PYC77085.1 peptidase M48 [Streptomyces tateyamensis]
MTDPTQAAGTPSRRRKRFPGISTRAWEHPADRSALVALRRLTGFDDVIKKLAGLVSERSVRLMFLATAVKTSERQYPEIYNMVRDAAYVLDLEKVPDLFVTQDPTVNAMCIGMDTPVIVLTTGLVELLDEEELRAVVGHEVGHAMSGHAVYRTMMLILSGLATRLGWLPLGNLAIMALVTALKEWFRKAELSCDRAGLLAGQDPQASMRGLMKLAGGHNLGEMNVDAFLEQAAEYEKAGDLRDSALKLLQVLPQTHPFAVVRVAKLKQWSESEEYRSILAGAYPLRTDDGEAKVSDQWKAAADSYGKSIKESKDPLFNLLKDIADGAGTVGGKLRDTFTGARGPAGGGTGGTPEDAEQK